MAQTASGQVGTVGISVGIGSAFGVVMSTLDHRLGWELGDQFWGSALLLGCAGIGMLPVFIVRIRDAFHGKIDRNDEGEQDGKAAPQGETRQP